MACGFGVLPRLLREQPEEADGQAGSRDDGPDSGRGGFPGSRSRSAARPRASRA